MKGGGFTRVKGGSQTEGFPSSQRPRRAQWVVNLWLLLVSDGYSSANISREVGPKLLGDAGSRAQIRSSAAGLDGEQALERRSMRGESRR